MPSYEKRGDSWRVRIYHHGLIQSRTFPTKTECQQWAEDELYLLRHGKPRHPTRHLLREAFDKYALEVSPKHKGERWEVLRLNAIGRSQMAAKPISRVTAGDIAKYRDMRLSAVKSGTVIKELNLISSVFNVAIREWGWVGANPVKQIKRPKPPPPRRRRITDDEASTICQHLKNATVRVAFLFALETACRLGEILGIRPGDIHDDWVRVDGKTGVRDVPLSPRAKELVTELVTLKWVRPATASQLFRRAVIASGVEGVTFHDSRHEACHRLAEKLPNVLDLCMVTGHTNPSMLLKVYYHPSASALSAKLR